MTTISLFDLQTFLRQVVALNFPEALWVRCEIAQLSKSRGHVYLDLVEKAETENEPIAQASAAIWQSTLKRLQSKLGATNLNPLLQAGVEVLLRVKVEYHERYGLKLVVEDIDPSYTLGKLEQRRRQLYEQLVAQGLMGKNAQIPLRPVLQRIAIISSATAAGYQDFLQHLGENAYGYAFKTTFFAAAVQGAQVEVEVLKQLRAVQRQATRFDAVALIRGGGAKLDLAGFDSLALCQAIADFPLPVFTGIGHDVDETLVDLVAHSALKTPTAVADFLIQHNLHFESQLAELSQYLRYVTAESIHVALLQLAASVQALQTAPVQLLDRQKDYLQRFAAELPLALRYQQREQWQRLEQMEQICQLLSIEGTLQRGFSLTLKAGKPIASAQQARQGDVLDIQLKDGTLRSKVE
ncbi:exodeoxyribonuclease VII large subunit [Haliscomenobacter hydrossis]|uniref:Exodeoxyribonuclease 7 large subunit n=1 Tax=Haliscomenobacter hydrossis (strain ATCC 27775 / DSM 1100 / LMG 10767 / O) TaxID=760192 RepID=F4L3H1_HALH1|nr:exodeoxyribonuclease VII large subunit [Haliscomenobacter hydrossis]AEE52948.1 Exodeoxyribonuclease VII [Haliscomenobacter hydrossis DSM 1100]